MSANFLGWIAPFLAALKDRRSHVAIALGFTVFVCIGFLPAVRGGFVYDDKGQILHNPRIMSLTVMITIDGTVTNFCDRRHGSDQADAKIAPSFIPCDADTFSPKLEFVAQ